MATKQPLRVRLRTFVRVWVDALTYAVALTAVTAIVAVALGVMTGGAFVRGKRILFVFGWVMMAYATGKLWVKSGKQLRDSSKRKQGRPQSQHQPDEEQPDSGTPATTFRSSGGNDATRRNVYGESLRERQDATRFQSLVRALPPNRWTLPPRPEKRIGVTGKILLSSVLVLALSFVMETVFGVV